MVETEMTRKPSVAVFYDGSRSPQWAWSHFLQGQNGLSGTDSQVLRLAYHLAHHPHYRFAFLSNTAKESADGVVTHVVTGVKDSVRWCAREGFEMLVLVCREYLHLTEVAMCPFLPRGIIN